MFSIARKMLQETIKKKSIFFFIGVNLLKSKVSFLLCVIIINYLENNETL